MNENLKVLCKLILELTQAKEKEISILYEIITRIYKEATKEDK